jgi:transposase-like protein
MAGYIAQLIESIERLRVAIEMQHSMPRKVTVEDALAMLVTVGPNVSEIARRLGVNRRVLYRADFHKFQKALEVAREACSSRSCARGHKIDSRLEAWDFDQVPG